MNKGKNTVKEPEGWKVLVWDLGINTDRGDRAGVGTDHMRKALGCRSGGIKNSFVVYFCEP